MFSLRSKRTVVFIFVLLLMLAMVACGSNSATNSVTTGDSTQAAPVEQAVDAGAAVSESETTTAATKLNLNTALEAEFLTIPGMGDRMVREFFEYRPYVSIAQFRREIGKYVNDEQVAAYEQYVYVPISANESDAATLQQIGGLDEGEAATLIDGRPYASNEAFLAALTPYVAADELAVAATYLDSQ